MSILRKIEMGRQGMFSGLKSGMEDLDKYVHRIQRGSIDLWGANSKAGKTTIVDYRYILSVIENNPEMIQQKKIKWIYYAYEISLHEKQAKFIAYFMHRYYGKEVTPAYILSKGEHRLSDDDLILVKKIYQAIILPLFGEYNDRGKRIKDGLIDYYETKLNPTGIYYSLKAYASSNGDFEYDYTTYIDDKGQERSRKSPIAYNPDDDEAYVIIIVDHVGKVKRERGMDDKGTLDILGSYMVELRNLCGYTFVPISQFNRSMSNTDRFKFSGTMLAPGKADFKGTGNLVEDANFVYGIFNPSEYPHLANQVIDGYNIKKLGLGARIIHLIASREVAAPMKKAIYVSPGNNLVLELPKAFVKQASVNVTNPQLNIYYRKIHEGTLFEHRNAA